MQYIIKRTDCPTNDLTIMKEATFRFCMEFKQKFPAIKIIKDHVVFAVGIVIEVAAENGSGIDEIQNAFPCKVEEVI